MVTVARLRLGHLAVRCRGPREVAQRVLRIAQTVLRIVIVVVACGICRNECREAVARMLHVAPVEEAVTQIVLRQRILAFGAGRTAQIRFVAAHGALAIAARIGYLALPERRQGGIFRTHSHFGRLLHAALGTVEIAPIESLQAAEVCYLLQCRPHIRVVHRRRVGLYGLVCGIVVARIVVGRHQQLARSGRTLRRRIAFDILFEDVDRLVEHASAQLVSQLAVVEQRIFGYRGIVSAARGHGETVGGTRLVAAAQVAVAQMIRRVLRQLVVGAANLHERCRGIVVARQTVERITRYVVLLASHAIGRIALHVSYGLGIVAQTEPRLGRHAHQIGTHLIVGGREQAVGIIDDVCIVAAAELYLQEVVRYHVAIRCAMLYRAEALVRTVVVAALIVDIGQIVSCMVVVLAAARDPLETPLRRIRIALRQTHVAYAYVVTLPLPGGKLPVIDPRKLLVGRSRIASVAQHAGQREMSVIEIRRRGILRDETSQRMLGIGCAGMHHALRQQEIRMFDLAALGQRVETLSEVGKLGARICPALRAQQRLYALHGAPRLRRRCPGRLPRRHERREQRQYDGFTHNIL